MKVLKKWQSPEIKIVKLEKPLMNETSLTEDEEAGSLDLKFEEETEFPDEE